MGGHKRLHVLPGSGVARDLGQGGQKFFEGGPLTTVGGPLANT